jgi:AraC-like DNA-binding protein
VKAALFSEFVAEPRATPVGRYVIGPTYVAWCLNRSLMGTSLFGRPNEADARQLVRLFDAARHPAVAPKYDSVSDGRHLEAVDLGAFSCIAAHMAARADELRRRVQRHALVVPEGLAGAVLAGTGEVTGATGFHQVFRVLDDAFGWLERPDADEAREVVERLLGQARGGGMYEVVALRAHLSASPAGASLASASRKLGCSSRALQRALEHANTSFRAELSDARLNLASDLLRHSDEKLEAIARRVGFASSSAFCRWFRNLTGQVPTAFRSRRAASPATRSGY